MDESRLAQWLDAKLLQFVDTWLQLEMADQYQKENLVTDPVCGSQITEVCAVAQEDHQGRKCFFFSRLFQSRFSENLSQYMWVVHK